MTIRCRRLPRQNPRTRSPLHLVHERLEFIAAAGVSGSLRAGHERDEVIHHALERPQFCRGGDGCVDEGRIALDLGRE